ncbi:hypothetical protein QM999_09640 [Pectobacterium cacticida]|uniref:hypothetical protein n=2 Tax=Pectobacterium cacticida TaxID=69221 RepID=UPI002FF0830A
MGWRVGGLAGWRCQNKNIFFSRCYFYKKELVINKYDTFLAIPFVLSMPLTVMGDEPQWLEGGFVNQDKSSLNKSLTFCPAGQALYDFIKAAYVVEGKDDNRVITLYSNGAFTIKVSYNGNALLPGDELTKTWLTKNKPHAPKKRRGLER